jgi:hypothetical protein
MMDTSFPLVVNLYAIIRSLLCAFIDMYHLTTVCNNSVYLYYSPVATQLALTQFMIIISRYSV